MPDLWILAEANASKARAPVLVVQTQPRPEHGETAERLVRASAKWASVQRSLILQLISNRHERKT